MQRFLSTASLSVLTAIAIVAYSSSPSTPISKGVAASSPSTPLTGFLDLEKVWGADFVESSINSIGYGLGEDLGIREKNDQLALVPHQFSSCVVGLVSRSSWLDE